eukprot:scaffold147678_cov48-Prasinocladus_malaysianus.AAC.1
MATRDGWFKKEQMEQTSTRGIGRYVYNCQAVNVYPYGGDENSQVVIHQTETRKEDKSIMDPATEMLVELMRSLRIETSHGTLKVTEVEECKGFCVLSRRKKDKTMILHDLSLILNWELVPTALQEDECNTIFGHIT